MYSYTFDGVAISLTPHLEKGFIVSYAADGYEGLRAKRDACAYDLPAAHMQYPRRGTEIKKGQEISFGRFLQGYKERDFELVTSVLRRDERTEGNEQAEFSSLMAEVEANKAAVEQRKSAAPNRAASKHSNGIEI
jgi:hypothetical protein